MTTDTIHVDNRTITTTVAPASDSTMTADYVYDAFNNRISKIVDADGTGAGSSVRTNFALLDGEVDVRECMGLDLVREEDLLQTRQLDDAP